MSTTSPEADRPTVEPRVPATAGQRLVELQRRIADAVGADGPVDADATFAELGVTSLRAAIVLAGIWRDWDTRVSLVDLGTDSTARVLADRIDQLLTAP